MLARELGGPSNLDIIAAIRMVPVRGSYRGVAGSNPAVASNGTGRPEPEREPVEHRKAALLSCVGAGFATLLDAAVIAYTAPALVSGSGASAATVQWFLAVYSLTFGLGLVPGGRIGDALGRRRPLLLGLALILVGASTSALGPVAVTLIAGRLVQGLGAGLVSAQVLGLIQDHFHGTERIRAFGAYTAAGAAAGMAGPLLAGAVLLLATPDPAWRIVLLLPVPAIFATIWIVWRQLPADPVRARGPIALDLPGIALLGGIVVLITLPVIDPGLPVALTAGIFAIVVVLAIALVFWERRYGRRGRLPLFAPALMRERGFLAGNAVAMLWFGSLLGSSTVLTIYVLQHLGTPALLLAALMLPGAAARLVAARYSARAFARWGAPLVTGGVGAESVGMLLLAGGALALDPAPLLVLIVVVQVGLGICSGVSEPMIRVLALARAPQGMAGVAASFLQLTQRLAATLAVALGTGILLAGGTSAASLATALIIFAGCALVAALATRQREFRTAV